jgi:hypothetical protein
VLVRIYGERHVQQEVELQVAHPYNSREQFTQLPPERYRVWLHAVQFVGDEKHSRQGGVQGRAIEVLV